MYYYGTSLNQAGHYFWELDGNNLLNNKLRFSDFTFNPEDMPKREKGEGIRNGDVKYYNEGGYTICAIEGSCSDNRPASKSVFWVKEDITNEELKNRILNLPIAKKIIKQMPFDVRWDE